MYVQYILLLMQILLSYNYNTSLDRDEAGSQKSLARKPSQKHEDKSGDRVVTFTTSNNKMFNERMLLCTY